MDFLSDVELLFKSLSPPFQILCLAAAAAVIVTVAWVLEICCDRRDYIRQRVRADAMNYFSDTYDLKWLEKQTDKYMEKGVCWLLRHDVRSLDRDKQTNTN